jgi:hypothetical protein
MNFNTRDWNNLFKCIIAILRESTDPFRALTETRLIWSHLKQTGSISSYLYEESKLWGKMVSQSRWVNRSLPTEDDRLEVICSSINRDTAVRLSELARRRQLNPREIKLEKMLTMLTELDAGDTTQFQWEKRKE